MVEPGDRVIIDGDVPGIVEEVIHVRGRAEPLVLVEWWKDGQLVNHRFVLEDLRVDRQRVKPAPPPNKYHEKPGFKIGGE